MDNIAKKSKQPLLAKYKIPIEHLDFSYIEKCNDTKEIENIIEILSSGEEGYYPQLVQCAEKRLYVLNPSSRLFRSEYSVLNQKSLNDSEWQEVEDLIEKFIVRSKEECQLRKKITCCDEKNHPEVPPIRCTNTNVIEGARSSEREKSNRIKSDDYHKWEKYDSELELMKMDLREEIGKKQAEREKKRNDAPKIEIIEPSTMSSLSDREKRELADSHKIKGNEFFKSCDYGEAVNEYTRSLLFLKTSVVLNNRAIAYIKLKQFSKAINDCEECLRTEPNNLKALLRFALALKSMGNLHTAYDTYLKVLQIDAHNHFAKKEIEIIRKQIPAPPPAAVRIKIQECEENYGKLETETNDCFSELIKPNKIIQNKVPKALPHLKQIKKSVERNLRSLEKQN